jgi:hypothetical protein
MGGIACEWVTILCDLSKREERKAHSKMVNICLCVTIQFNSIIARGERE